MSRCATLYDEPGLATVARWWSRRRGRSEFAPPPLPAFCHPTQPLAMLRANWVADGDLLAVDARGPDRTLVELMVKGQPVLGPEWTGAEERTRLDSWTTDSSADCIEWSFGTGRRWVTRTLVLLRGRGLALVAEERDGADGLRIGLASGVAAKPTRGGRDLILKASSKGPGIGVIPLSLPEHAAGSLETADGLLRLATPPAAGRAWHPLLFSWHESRVRKTPQWRTLTVSENSRACPANVAFAARVSWGPGDSLVFYRSLAAPARRAFLGYQTSSRFVIGTFSDQGIVTPLLDLD